ncbi:MAG TPA: twin-arginine translocase TatA/TatE family subunit [Aquificaceae bacterium]|nr:twin-arginine translocase TatA/TatE family subunit [Aquificaceae bacterium]HIQ48231.1 twin-arginine translocase TatA/TatE family subunit [Aquifex aeolicus]
MFPGGISMTELIIILAIVLLLFGAGKLPEAGRALGEGIRNFRKALSGETESVKEVKAEDVRTEEKREEKEEVKA